MLSECGVLITLEQTRDFSTGGKGVHALKETEVKNVGLVHDEADLLALASGATQDNTKILVKVFASIFIRDLDLEDAETIQPGNKS